jgi:site-specific recombinase XerD
MIMKTTDFAQYVTDYLGQYLPSECGLSQNTIKTYSLTFTLLLRYMQQVEKIKPERLTIADITKQRIIEFLQWTEKNRGCSISTRNARLGTLHSFFKYLQYREVKGLFTWQEIMSVKYKKHQKPEMAFLSTEAVTLVLQQPDLHSRTGLRDFALLGLLYDSAARVQELIDMTPADLRFGDTTTITIRGKGSKVRIVPLSEKQVRNLKIYLEKNNLLDKSRIVLPLFPNPQCNRMSRMAVLNIVKKYAGMARRINPALIPEDIGCHSFRHSKAMHMLEADIHLVHIRDFLGHSSVDTTELYARASEKKKQEALAKLNPDIIVEGKTSWQKDKNLMKYLKGLQNKY